MMSIAKGMQNITNKLFINYIQNFQNKLIIPQDKN